MYRLLTVFLFSLSLIAGPLQAASRIHVIIAVDSTDKNIGPAVLIDGNMIKHVFQGNVPSARLQLHDVLPIRFGVPVPEMPTATGFSAREAANCWEWRSKPSDPELPPKKPGLRRRTSWSK